MASFLSNATSSPRVQLAVTAVVSAALAAATVVGIQRLRQEERTWALKSSIPEPAENGSATNEVPPTALSGHLPRPDKNDLYNETLARRAQTGDWDDALVHEQLARTAAFLTPAGLARVRDAFVVVVGCGGVGSHCAAALARSGVSRLRLVDFDQVTLSSLNRHAVAALADVGTAKVRCLQRRLVAVAPWVRFDLRLDKFDAGSAERLLGPWVGDGGGDGEGDMPSFVIDAIDNIDSKVELLRFCHERGLPVISSMGAGCKSDPTRVAVSDIGTSTDDRLSKATRRRLKLLGITTGIPVVYSTEKAGEGKAELLPLPEEEFEKGKVGELGVLPDFRVRILPVLGTMPAVFGYTLANHVLLSISGYPMEYAPPNTRSKLYDALQGLVQGQEEKMVRWQTGGSADISVGLKVPLSTADAAFLLDEVYRAKSAITGVYTRLTLTRWRRPAGPIMVRIGEGEGEQKSTNLRLRDLVCMTREEAAVHEKEVLQGDRQPEELYDKETVERVEARLKLAEAYEKYR